MERLYSKIIGKKVSNMSNISLTGSVCIYIITEYYYYIGVLIYYIILYV